MFYRMKELDTETALLLFVMAVFLLIFAVDQLFMPDVQPPQVSIKVNF
ncbi:hypothetical protein [Persephonella sp.]